MDLAIEKLKIAVSDRDQTAIRECLNLLIDTVNNNEIESNVNIDYIIRDILKYTPCVEYLDKIASLISLIKAPGIFFNEILQFTYKPNTIVPALMLIYEIKCKFEIEYDDFYLEIKNSINNIHVRSEGYLIFLLRTLKNINIPQNEIISIIKKLTEVSLEVITGDCIKVLYTILVIMRMHPGCFNIVYELNILYMFLESFDSVSAIARRIFIEAENPECRPQAVFLQNFAFPDF